MAYTPNIWVDREGTTRYFETVEKDGAKIFTPDYSQLTEIGTPVNADNMNHIEEGIAAGSFTKYDSNTVYQINDLVTSFEGSELKVYKSLKSENYNNPVADTTYWEEVVLGGGSSLPIGSTIVVDKVLSFEESQGLALQGTYVYKTAIAGERYGYPDFYEKYVDYKNNATATQTTLGSSTITIYNNANGLKFYNIADKGVIDTFFNSAGVADFYGIDEANERIFLPRNNKFWQFTTNTGEVNNYVEAGLPNITGGFGSYASWNAYANGAFTNSNGAAAWKGGVDGVVANVTLDASRSSSVYGKSNTVQPPSSKKLLYYVVGNTVSDTSWVDVVTQVEDGVKDLEDKTQEGIERLKASSNALTTTQITNCITEIPQRIKYDLTDGTLTLKAGSVVVMPYGIEDKTNQFPIGATFLNENLKVVDTQYNDGKFFVRAEVQSDVSDDAKETAIYNRFVCFNAAYNGFSRFNNVSSGAGDTTSNWRLHYSTDQNIIMSTNGSGVIEYTDTISFPFLIATGDGVHSYGSIKQVFNGIGYIGSTIWVDKGVKGLIPNGRNEDGTLNNREFETQNIMTYSSIDGTTGEFQIQLSETGIGRAKKSYWKHYVQENLNKGTDGVRLGRALVGSMTLANDVISNFQPKQPFRAIDYSDKSTISGWAMPSSKYIDLTLGASGSTYIAPANGWVRFVYTVATQGGWGSLVNNTNGLWMGLPGNYYTNGEHSMFIPVKKGDVYSIHYGGSTWKSLWFVYAEGEV